MPIAYYYLFVPTFVAFIYKNPMGWLMFCFAGKATEIQTIN